MTDRRKHRILIVDDHPIVRQGYAQLIGKQADLTVSGSTASESEALDSLAERPADLAVVDISLKDSSGIELIEKMSRGHAEVKVLVISAHDENLYAERAVEAGASGYINKQEATEKLIEGIHTVLGGRVYFSDTITRRLLQNRIGNRQGGERSPIESLTNRELEVFALIGHGKTSRHIADKLHLSPKTIERYKENVKRKLRITNATELIQHATRWVLENP